MRATVAKNQLQISRDSLERACLQKQEAPYPAHRSSPPMLSISTPSASPIHFT